METLFDFCGTKMKMKLLSEYISQSKICDDRICRVLLRVTSSPFLLTSTINKHTKPSNNKDPKIY